MRTEAKEDEAKSDEVVFVSKEDRLESENLHLRVLNVAYELKGLQEEISAKRNALSELQRRILDKRSEIEKKYNINLSTHQIREEDGAVLPAEQAGVGMKQRLNAIQS